MSAKERIERRKLRDESTMSRLKTGKENHIEGGKGSSERGEKKCRRPTRDRRSEENKAKR